MEYVRWRGKRSRTKTESQGENRRPRGHLYLLILSDLRVVFSLSGPSIPCEPIEEKDEALENRLHPSRHRAAFSPVIQSRIRDYFLLILRDLRIVFGRSNRIWGHRMEGVKHWKADSLFVSSCRGPRCTMDVSQGLGCVSPSELSPQGKESHTKAQRHKGGKGGKAVIVGLPYR